MSILQHPIDPCIEYWTVRLLNFIISILNFFTNLTLGWTYSYGATSDRAASESDFSKGAQLVDIKYFAGYAFIEEVQLNKNFFWKHNRYLNPNFILENDNVTLNGMTSTHAYFCVATADVTNSELFPFMVLGQKMAAEQLIILPIKHFHRLAQEVGDPKLKVACIHMTARCGSTLLSQVFNKVPGTQVFIEPFVTMDIQRHYAKNRWTQEETDECVRNAVRLLMKPIHNKKVDFIVWKVTPFTNVHIPTIMKAFPKFKWIFNTRTLKPAMKSFVKTVNSQPRFYLSTGIFFSKFWWNNIAVPRDDRTWMKVLNDYRG